MAKRVTSRAAREAARERLERARSGGDTMVDDEPQIDETGLQPIVPEVETSAPSDDPVSPTPSGPFRPSDLARMVAEHAKESNTEPHLIDRFKFLRERGLPNPTRLYRVSVRHNGEIRDTTEVEAVDESAAINAAAQRLGIPTKAMHSRVFHAIAIEE